MSRRVVLWVGIGLSIAAVILASVAAEFLARLVLDPVDFLQPSVEYDERYGHRITRGSGGHDALGFRNPRVPDVAEVIAVGDSQTYGESAPARESWPGWLGDLIGRTVYNAGVGGYGPIQYDRLFPDLATAFAPRLVIVGIYTGNDILDAFRSCPQYTPPFEDPASCGPMPRESVGPLRADETEQTRLLGPLRDWLSRHSVIYQAAKFSLGSLTSLIRSREIDSGVTVVSIADSPMTFDLPLWWRQMNLDMADVNAGLHITEKVVRSISMRCRNTHTECLFVIIPTKESVYMELVEGYLDEDSRSLYTAIVEFDTEINNRLRGWINDHGGRYVDPLDALRSAVQTNWNLYPIHDSHPSASGYRVIADQVAATILETSLLVAPDESSPGPFNGATMPSK